ncbi:MAG: nuclear transport factor 2 family protein [Caldilineaceae bacterium]
MCCIDLYWAAWRKHDAPALVSLYAVNGTYQDPLTDKPLTGAAIGEHARTFWAALPDMRFEQTKTLAVDGLIAVAWRLHGICTGSWQGLPPSGRTICLPGATHFQIAECKINSAQGYFDVKTLLEQLDF